MVLSLDSGTKEYHSHSPAQYEAIAFVITVKSCSEMQGTVACLSDRQYSWIPWDCNLPALSLCWVEVLARYHKLYPFVYHVSFK